MEDMEDITEADYKHKKIIFRVVKIKRYKT